MGSRQGRKVGRPTRSARAALLVVVSCTLTACSAGGSAGRFAVPVAPHALSAGDSVTFRELQTVLDAFVPERGEGSLPDAIEQELKMLQTDSSTEGVRVGHYAARYVGSVGSTGFYVSAAGSRVCVQAGTDDLKGGFTGGTACGGLDALVRAEEFTVTMTDSQTSLTAMIIPSDCRFRSDGPGQRVDFASLVVMKSEQLHGDLICDIRPSQRIDLDASTR